MFGDAPMTPANYKRKAEGDAEAAGAGDDGNLRGVVTSLAKLALIHEQERMTAARDENFVLAMKPDHEMNVKLEWAASQYTEEGTKARKETKPEEEELLRSSMAVTLTGRRSLRWL